ncbi:MAG TPA: ABATE domain-containing protein [Vicinamibacterales bacterium]|nr:ABATE domain-containing protein [Vicinamibacterales bacterium]
MSSTSPAYQFDFSGGDLSLDFVNTVGDRPRREEEHLSTWRALVNWAEQADVVSKRAAAALRTDDQARGEAMTRAFSRAIALRECLYRIFHSQTHRHAPARQDLAALNDALAGVLGHARVESRGSDFVWTWDGDEPSIDRVLWPVVRAAAELLVSPARTRVRECASGTCSWLFIDKSPTQRRRWCSMKTCGNRDKVRRFYERKREHAD